MKIENIYGCGIKYSKYADPIRGTIKTLLVLFRMRFNDDEILKMCGTTVSGFPGKRFKSDDIIVERICSTLACNTIKEYQHVLADMTENEKHSMIDCVIKSFVDGLRGKEIDNIIIECMRNCSIVDKWYENKW